MKPKKVITSHIHSRITLLAAEAIKQGLVVQCDRTNQNTYLIRKPNESVATEFTPISAGTFLLTLLGKIE
ncbi:hypothetical protein [Microseira sp. BLCC-F43]|jgi:hypothetical protein|uniref:hypothetical protein n=1 Tax=Microseira sp. BLCC-F43 TaxID=3153602 RepID=UPI0035B7CF27